MDNDSRLLVIGVGNPHRRDDSVGLVIAREISERAPEDVRVYENHGEVATLIELLGNADTVILVDAVRSSADAGHLFRFDAIQEEIPVDSFRCSTHAFSIPEAIGFARALGQLPRRVIVYGVEGKDFNMGEGLSPEVETAVGIITSRILSEIRDLRKCPQE